MSLTVFAPPPAHEIQALEEQISDRKQRRNSVTRNSFYYAVSRQFQMKGKRVTAAKLRQKCVAYLQNNDVIGTDENVSWKDGISLTKVEEYLSFLDDPNEEHVDEYVIQAAANLLKSTINITCPGVDDLMFEPIRPNAKPRFITIGRIGGQHYYSLENDQTVLSNEALRKGAELLQGAGPTKTAMKGKNTTLTGKRKRVTMKGPSKSDDDSDDDGSQRDSSDSDLISSDSEEEEKVTIDFEEETEEESREEDGFFLKLATKLAKYVSTIIFAGAVFLGGIATKSTLLVLGNAYSQDYSKSSCPSVGNQHYYTRYMVMLILMTCLCFPEVLALLLSLWKVIKTNKKTESESKQEGDTVSWKLAFFVGMIPEILHAIGLTFLTLKVIPSIDSTLAVLTFSLVAMIPAIQQVIGKFISLSNKPGPVEDSGSVSSVGTDVHRDRLHIKRDFILSVFALVLLPAGYGLVHWQIYEQYVNVGLLSCTIASLLLISTRYWENFVLPVTATVEETSPNLRSTPMQPQALSQDSKAKNTSMTQGVAKKLEEYRFESTILYSIIRICFIVVCCFVIHFVVDGNQSIVTFRGNTPVYFGESPRIDTRCSRIITSFWYAGLTNSLCSFGTFFSGLLACKTCVRVPAFLLPLALTNPIMCVLTSVYNVAGAQKGETLMDFFKLPIQYAYVNDLIGWKTTYTEIDPLMMAVVVIAGLFTGCLGLVFVTSYLWQERNRVMERVDFQFVKPIYAGPLINEEMMLNHRQYVKSASGDSIHGLNYIPHVFLCATMWHETSEEMKQLLTSIMRLDLFQEQTKKKNKKTQTTDKDTFQFEVHILFDDAFDKEDNECRLNTYVKTFLDLIENAADTVKNDSSKEIFPVQMETPYGGRIQYRLPQGKNIMHIHLKDTEKIRKKKRWSQCMYLSYILLHLRDTRQRYDLSKIFILALDGDVDFQPSALTYLLDRMKTNEQVGAACGRIHPIGNGPVVWFQKFEYAVGHWLQKTAEDVLGCVLCSPGCFSLFRGEALMRPNVAAKYREQASEAGHKIQWDQGEDRWLCTLLLKQGRKIEYCAASDSYTFAPEDFKEFYNQRRRWGPSTVANIFDILLDAKKAVRKNSNITWGYIVYQAGLLFSSLLGPSTVVLVVQGAFQYVFGMSAIGGLMAALIPVVVFVIICYTTKADTQIIVAMVLTLLYALVMMAVLVGVIGQMAESLLNPSSIFMLLMIAIFTITGILHPTEIMCLIHGVLYYLCVPSAFIFLPVYSYCNMNNVSWGTREEPKIKGDGVKTNAGGDKDEEKGNYGCGLGSMCKCMICMNPSKRRSTNGHAYHRIATTEPRTVLGPIQRKIGSKSTALSKSQKKKLMRKFSKAESFYMGEEDTENIPEDRSDTRDDLSQSRVFWKRAPQLQNAKTKKINRKEQEFWEKQIKDYLHPINQTDKQEIKKKKKLKVELNTLKNKMSGAYLFINSLWIVLTFTLTLVIHDVNITIYDRYGNVTVVNPLAFLFLIFFLVILLIQFIAMLFHRGHTFVHFMSKTSFWWNDKHDKVNTKKNAAQRKTRPLQTGTDNQSFRDDRPGTSGATATREAWGVSTNSKVRASSELPKDQDILPHQVPRSHKKDDGKAKTKDKGEIALATSTGGPATAEPKSSKYETFAA